jgi:hypothetical protein
MLMRGEYFFLVGDESAVHCQERRVLFRNQRQSVESCAKDLCSGQRSEMRR